MSKVLSITICLILIILIFMVSGCASYQVPKNIQAIGGGSDIDKDGLSDQQEVVLMTDPKKPDTDGDGLKDGAEIDMQLDPKNPDTDGDTVPDANDAWPRLKNDALYLYSAISVIIIALIITSTIHLKIGITEKRKQIVKNIREKREEEEALFNQVRERIEKLAEQKYGWLILDEVAKELAIDSRLLAKYFITLKARKKGSFYRFPDIEKSFRR